MNAPSRHTVRRALIWRSGGQATAQLLLWASTFVVLRLLVPADYGLVAMAAVLTGFLALLSGQGFTSALVQAPTLKPADIRRFLGLLIVVNLGLAAAQVALAPTAAAYYRTPAVADLLYVQALAYVAIPFIAVPAALAQREMNFRTPALIDLAGSVAGAAAMLALAIAHRGVWALVAGQLAPLIVRALLWTVHGGWPRLPSFHLRALGGLARFGGAVTLNGIVWFLYAQADIVIAGRRMLPHEVGLYSTALFLAALPVAKLIPILNEVGFSAYSRVSHDRTAVATGFLKAARLVSLVTFPIFVGLAATAPTLAPLLLGQKWADAVPAIRLLALAMPLYAIANLFGPAVNALGHPRVQLGNALIGLAVMPAAFWIGSGHGATGLAGAWALAYPLLFVASASRSLRVIHAPPAALGRSIAPAILAATVMAAVVFTLAGVDQASWFRLAVQVLGGAATYVAVIRLAFPRRAAEMLALSRSPS